MEKRVFFHLHMDKFVWRKLWSSLAIMAMLGAMSGCAPASVQPQRDRANREADSSDAQRLVASLRLPGDSETYINPDDSNDHIISVGDTIFGRPGVANSHNIRQALDALLNTDIIVPIWDLVEGGGNNIRYRVAGFARLRLTSYHLPGENRMSAQFLGPAPRQ